MKTAIAGKLIIILIAASSLLIYLYSKKIENEVIEKRKTPPATAQVEKFLNDSGLKGISKESIVYFDHGPDKSNPMLFLSQSKSDYYQVALKLKPEEAGKFVENEILSSKRESNSLLAFPKGFESAKKENVKPYLNLSGESPTSKYTNLYATIDDHGDFSYVYIFLALPEDPIATPEQTAPISLGK